MIFTILEKIKNFFFNPKNKQLVNFLLIAFLVLVILMQRSCNSDLKNKLENKDSEITRINNNIDASKDILKQYKINDSTYRAERLAYSITLKELNNNYKGLLSGFEDFKKSPPKVIINQPLLIREIIKEIPVTATIDNKGVGKFNFTSEVNYPDNNYRKINGYIPFTSKFFNKSDSSVVNYENLPYYLNLDPGSANIDLEQKINIKLGLFEDPKTKKIKIAANTSYPGITFTGLDAYDILNEDLIKKQNQGGKKTWGLGLHIGYGSTVNLSTNKMYFGPQIGIGLNYSPKWAQWGK